MRRLRWSIVLIFLVMMAAQVVPVLACSMGPEPEFEGMAEIASVIVHGQLVESDLAQQNYVLKVDTYLNGKTGPEYLVLSYNSPAAIQGMTDTNFSSDECVWLDTPLPLYEPGYYVLVTSPYYLRGPDVIDVYRNRYFRYFADRSFPVQTYDETTDTSIVYSRSDLEQFFLNLHQSVPLPPLRYSRYPATAPLLVMTEDGIEHLLTVTGRELKPVPESLRDLYIYCWYFGEEHLDRCDNWMQYTTLASDGRSAVMNAEDKRVYVECVERCHHFEFQAENYLTSLIGLAAWQGNTLTIYALHDALHYASEGVIGDKPIPRLIAEYTFEPDALPGADHSAWSPDGQLLAFSDARGLWLWDAFTPDAVPRLLLPADENIPVALEISGHNRYLSVEQGDNKFILDLISQKRLPFGYISPDERLMMRCESVVNMSEEAGRPICQLQLYQLAPFSTLAGWGNFVEAGFRVQWVHDRRVLVQLCDYISKRCGVVDSNAYAPDEGGWYGIHMSPYVEFDMKPGLDFAVQGRNVAILLDEDTIEVNGDVLHVDMDSPIVALRWLPTVFYGENPYPPIR